MGVRGRKRAQSRESSLIKSLMHMGDGGKDAVSCVSKCRYGEVRHSWKECLDTCVTNHLLRSTLSLMLPDEHHDAPAEHHSMPEDLKDHVPKKVLLSRMRSAEL